MIDISSELFPGRILWRSFRHPVHSRHTPHVSGANVQQLYPGSYSHTIGFRHAPQVNKAPVQYFYQDSKEANHTISSSGTHLTEQGNDAVALQYTWGRISYTNNFRLAPSLEKVTRSAALLGHRASDGQTTLQARTH